MECSPRKPARRVSISSGARSWAVRAGFYCAARKLVIEVDGGYHDDPDQRERDEARTAHLNAWGYTVLRFRNEEVLTDLPSVIARIEAALK